MEPSIVDTPRKRKRSQKSIQTEEAILTHAIAVFRERGFEAATTKEIALAADVAEGTIFHYFPTKLALLEGVMIDYYARLQQKAERILTEAEDPISALRGLIRHHLLSAKREWKTLRIVIQHGRYDPNAFGETFYHLNRRYTRLFTGLIDRLKGEMVIRQTVPTPLVRDTLFGSMEHFMIGHFGREREYDLDRYESQLLDLLFFGLK